MKNRLFALWVLALTIGLVGCTKTPPKPTPDPDDDDDPIVEPVYHSYLMTENRFEYFIEVHNHVEHNGTTYVVTTTFDFHEDYLYEDIEVSFFVYISYLLPEARSLYSIALTETISAENRVFEEELPFHDAQEVEVFYFMVVYASGNVKSLETLQPTNKTYEFPEFINDVEPGDKPVTIEILDPEANQSVYQTLIDKIATYDAQEGHSFIRSQSSLYTYIGTYQTATESTFSAIQASDSPFYLELFDGEYTTIIMEKQGKLFAYRYGPNNLVNGVYQIDPEILGDLSDLGIDDLADEKSVNELRLDPSKMRFEIVDQGILVTGMIYDIFTDEEYYLISSLYLAIGVSVENLRNTVVSAYYMISDDDYVLVVNLSIKANVGNLETINILTSTTFSITDIKMTDLNSEEFLIKHPNSIEKVLDFTDTSDWVENDQQPSMHFYKTELLEGQYLIHDRDNSVIFELFDENGNALLNATPLDYLRTERYFFVPADGIYYVKVTTRTSAAYSGYAFYLEALNYETPFDIYNPTPLSLGEQTVSLEGRYDYHHLRFSASEPSLLSFALSAEEGFVNLFYYEPRTQSYTQTQFPFVSQAAISVNQGFSYFIIQAQTATNVSIVINQFDTSHHKSDELDDMMLITDTFEGEPYFSSDILGPTYFKMEIPEKMFVTFYVEQYGGISTSMLYIYDTSMTLVNSNPIMLSGYGITLEAGTYILKGTSSHLSGGRVRYEAVVYENQTFTFEIQSYLSMQPYEADFPKITSLHYDYDHEVSHVFTLTKQEQVLIRTNNFTLRDDLGQLISFTFSQYSQPNVQVFMLDAGTYTLTKFNKEVHASRSYSIGIAIISVVIPDDAPLGSSLAEIGHGYYQFEQSYQGDVEAVKVVLTETTTMIYSSIRAFLFDSDRALIGSVFNYHHTVLSPGVYYMVMYEYGYNNTSWNISFNPY